MSLKRKWQCARKSWALQDKCAWDFGSAIAPHMETLMGTQDGIQYPGSLLKKFLKRKLKRGSIRGE